MLPAPPRRPIRDEAGRVVKFVGVQVDVTSRTEGQVRPGLPPFFLRRGNHHGRASGVEPRVAAHPPLPLHTHTYTALCFAPHPPPPPTHTTTTTKTNAQL